MAELLYQDNLSEVWLGNCLHGDDVARVMQGRKADLLCLDAPYSEKTHSGHREGKLTADRAASFAASHADNPTPESAYAARHYATAAGASAARTDLEYAAWSPADVELFVSLWVPLTSGWCASITDSELAPAWGDSFDAAGLYRFAPLPLVETGSRVRMTGDGPSCWTCWIVVARPKCRTFASWGTLPGAYLQPAERDINSTGGSDRIGGGKPLQAMIRIVGDYSKRGGLVVDPTCGAGTTLMAAKMCGRRSIGIELDRGRAEIAVRRLKKSHEQGNLFEQVGT
jgi:hypothetical protein